VADRSKLEEIERALVANGVQHALKDELLRARDAVIVEQDRALSAERAYSALLEAKLQAAHAEIYRMDQARTSGSGFVPVEDAAREVGVSKKTALAKIRSGAWNLTARRVGRQSLLNVAEWRAWIFSRPEVVYSTKSQPGSVFTDEFEGN
jgi:hypothetical protein